MFSLGHPNLESRPSGALFRGATNQFTHRLLGTIKIHQHFAYVCNFFFLRFLFLFFFTEKKRHKKQEYISPSRDFKNKKTFYTQAEHLTSKRHLHTSRTFKYKKT